MRAWLVLTIVVTLFLSQIWMALPYSNMDLKRAAILRSPEDNNLRADLAYLAIAVGDLKTADILLSQLPVNRIALENVDSPENAVLGSQTTKFEELWKLRDLLSKDVINKLIEKWEFIKKNYVGYRDAYLQLASLYARLRNLVTAKEYLKIAYELDPNSEKVAAVRRIIESGGVIR